MSLPNHSRNKRVAVILVSSLMLFGCSDSVFEKRAKETEEKNKIIQEAKEPEVEDQPAAEVNISDAQKEALEKAEIKESAEEAVDSSELIERKELEVVSVPAKEEYTNVDEFSQYVNSLFYLYHSQKIDGKTFYQKMSPHFSENFKSLLPKGEKEQIEMFEVLQKAFLSRLKSEIVSYKITNIEIQSRVEEANVYRKYTQANGSVIYYESIYVKEDNRWLLFDDGPTPPYITNEELEKKMNENKGE